VEIIYLKQETKGLSVCLPQPEKRARMPEFFNWKHENRRKQRETRDWIKKRGYWKPDIPAGSAQPGSGISGRKTAGFVSCNTAVQRQREDKRFNREVEYWKEYLRKSVGG